MESDSHSQPQSPRRWTPRRIALVCALVLALGALYVVPRAVALQGVAVVVNLHFKDMMDHLEKLNMMHLRATLPQGRVDDRYFKRFPEKADPHNVMRWPRGMQYVALPFVGTFGPFSVWTVQLTNGVFSLILIIGVLLLGRAMGGWRVGCWGAALTILCPGLVAHSWYFSLDYALIGMVVVGCYLLWRTRYFSHPYYCLALACWSALALTIKISYPLYLGGPSLVALVLGLRRPGTRLRVLGFTAGAALLSLGLALLLNGWSLVRIWSELATHFSSDVRPEFAFQLMKPWTLRWALCNSIFAVANFPWPLLLLALPGLLLAHWRRKPLPTRWLVLALFWSTYVVLTLMPHKMERYIQPLYPLLCLLTVWWITVVVPRRWQIVPLLLTVVAFAVTLVAAHFHPTPWMPDKKGEVEELWMHEIGMPGERVLEGLRNTVYHPDCDIRPVLVQIQSLVDEQAEWRPVGVAINWPEDDARLGPWELLSAHIYIGMSQTRRDRFVIYKDVPNQNPLSTVQLEVPTLIVMHPPGRALGLPQMGQRHLKLRCAHEVIPVTLTAYHPTGDR